MFIQMNFNTKALKYAFFYSQAPHLLHFTTQLVGVLLQTVEQFSSFRVYHHGKKKESSRESIKMCRKNLINEMRKFIIKARA